MSKIKVKNPILFYAAVWTLCVLIYWLFAFFYDGWNWINMYTLMTFFIILPLATLVSAFFIEMKHDIGDWRVTVIAGHGIMYAAADWATYELSTAVGMTRFGDPTWLTFIPGLFLSAIGFVSGLAVHVIKKRIGTKNPPDSNIDKSV